MEPDTSQNNIHKNVSDAIRSGKVVMHSPLHFFLKSVLLVAALFGVFVLSTIILNFILFSIHIQSHQELLGFGMVGFLTFLDAFPWILFFIDCALIVAVLSLLRSFRVGYKTPVLYLGGGLLLVVMLLGIFVERTGSPMNTRMMHRIEEGKLPPPFPHIFTGIRGPFPHKRHVCRCEVLEIKDNGYLVARDTKTHAMRTFVLTKPATYATTSGLMIGDIVFIAGTFDGDGDADDVIEAFGIRKVIRE